MRPKKDRRKETMKTEKPFRLKRRPPRGYMTLQQAAEYMGVSARSVRRYIKERGFPAMKPAGRYLVKIEDMEKWIRENG